MYLSMDCTVQCPVATTNDIKSTLVVATMPYTSENSGSVLELVNTLNGVVKTMKAKNI
jgi:hypothetical protein